MRGYLSRGARCSSPGVARSPRELIDALVLTDGQPVAFQVNGRLRETVPASEIHKGRRPFFECRTPLSASGSLGL